MKSNGLYFSTITPERVREIVDKHERQKVEQAAYGRWLRLKADREWEEGLVQWKRGAEMIAKKLERTAFADIGKQTKLSSAFLYKHTHFLKISLYTPPV